MVDGSNFSNMMSPDSSEAEDVLSDLMAGSFSLTTPPSKDKNEADAFEESFAMPFDAPLVGASDYEEEDDDDYIYVAAMSCQGTRFETPIFFEDGMDYVECQLYYGLLASQHKGGILRRLRLERPRQTGAAVVSMPIARSCLRTPKRSNNDSDDDDDVSLEDVGSSSSRPPKSSKNKNKNKKSKKQQDCFRKHPPRKPMRRCSFTGTPQTDEVNAFSMLSVDDMQVLPEQRHVGFCEYAQVLTIPTRSDLFHIRAELWMSRQEMQNSMRNASVQVGNSENYWQISADDVEEDDDYQQQVEEEEEDSMLKYVKAAPSPSYHSKSHSSHCESKSDHCTSTASAAAVGTAEDTSVATDDAAGAASSTSAAGGNTVDGRHCSYESVIADIYLSVQTVQGGQHQQTSFAQ